MTIDKPFHFFLIPGFNLFTLVAQIMMLFHEAVKVLDNTCMPIRPVHM